MPTIVQRVSNAGAQGTRWRATPNAHRRKDQTVKISEKREETTSQGWLILTAVNWLSFIALQTKFKRLMADLSPDRHLLQEILRKKLSGLTARSQRLPI